MQQHIIVDPVSAGPPSEAESRVVIDDLKGATIGFLSNSKTNADAILEAVAEALTERFGITARLYVKRVPSISAEPEVLDQIAEQCTAAVIAMLDCGSCASWACADMVELSQRGVAVCGMASDRFDAFSRQVLEIKNAGDLGLAVVAHPVAGIPRQQAKGRVTAQTVDAVIAALTASSTASVPAPSTATERPDNVEFLAADADDLADQLTDLGWTDGLPVIIPSRERVERFSSASTSGDPDADLGAIAPRQGRLTVRTLAANAVMAGCRPEYMPVLEAATAALQEPDFNLYGMQMTTHPVAAMVMAQGPLAAELGMNAGTGCMGQGNRANGTIGRAVRLVMMNVGGAYPGDGEHHGAIDRATQGTPAKWSFCFAENETASPWQPFRVGLGFALDDSVVTVAAVEGPHNINDHHSSSGEEVLFTIAETMSTPGANTLYMGGDQFVVLGPEHAAVIADSGFSVADVQQYLFENARVPVDRIGAKKLEEAATWGVYRERLDTFGGRIPIAHDPQDIRIVVAGGVGKHSAWLPTFGPTYSQTQRIGVPQQGRQQAAPQLASASRSTQPEAAAAGGGS
jgi:hypothetical protein